MDIAAKLRTACVGHPHAKILWPHRLLHEAADRLEQLEAENARLREQVVAYCAPVAANWAHGQGLPPGHLHPTHYDDLAAAGARMDDFTRADLDRGNR